MITAIVIYDLPSSIGLEECRAHFAKIAPDFLAVPGFLRKEFICAADGSVAGGVYMWENRDAAERFYSGGWLEGIRARYGNEPRITYFETLALSDRASGQAGALPQDRPDPDLATDRLLPAAPGGRDPAWL